MKDNKPTLKRLESADPRAYVELCEKAGCYFVAYYFYKKSDKAMDLIHAAELAQMLGKGSRKVKRLGDLAMRMADEYLESNKNPHHPILGDGVGAAMIYISAEEQRNKVYQKAKKLYSR